MTFDDERALRATELLRELAADRQMIYLTFELTLPFGSSPSDA